ncbi:arginase family protein [uncultured Kocuria sp.]|uniref:arginase family protein n=1 Tax=uncultured Kocuria sp. TaxID=259305 RepID=UPI002604E16A|nr:arginase family protein [uncultured Kocuria sp.]
MSLPLVTVAQWQGSGSDRRDRLVTGVVALSELLQGSVASSVTIPAPTALNAIKPIEQVPALATIRADLAKTLQEIHGPVITIGGDCGVELAAVEHALAKTPGLAVVWFDAHADLNTIDSSPSGAFHGMVARALLGEAPPQLTPKAAVPADKFILAGTRAMDPAEQDYITAHSMTHLLPEALSEPTALLAAVDAVQPEALYLHVDVDVLDPSVINSTGFTEPEGMSLDSLTHCLRTLLAKYPLAGGGLTEFSPATPLAAREELPIIQEILDAFQTPQLP